jgi:hypothetical protein
MDRRERCIQHGAVSFDPDVDAYVACFQYPMLANVISSGDSEMTCLPSFARLFWGQSKSLLQAQYSAALVLILAGSVWLDYSIQTGREGVSYPERSSHWAC